MRVVQAKHQCLGMPIKNIKAHRIPMLLLPLPYSTSCHLRIVCLLVPIALTSPSCFTCVPSQNILPSPLMSTEVENNQTERVDSN